MAEPFALAADHATASFLSPWLALAPLGADGSPMTTVTLRDHAPRPFLLLARTRTWCVEPFLPLTTAVRFLTVRTFHADHFLALPLPVGHLVTGDLRTLGGRLPGHDVAALA